MAPSRPARLPQQVHWQQLNSEVPGIIKLDFIVKTKQLKHESLHAFLTQTNNRQTGCICSTRLRQHRDTISSDPAICLHGEDFVLLGRWCQSHDARVTDVNRDKNPWTPCVQVKSPRSTLALIRMNPQKSKARGVRGTATRLRLRSRSPAQSQRGAREFPGGLASGRRSNRKEEEAAETLIQMIPRQQEKN